MCIRDRVRLPLIDVHTALKRLSLRALPIPFSFGLIVLAGIAALSARSRPVTIFYVVIGTLYAVLGFGKATPLYGAFIKLPPGAATLRLPYRFFWLTGFSLAVLSGLAVNRLVDQHATARARWQVVATVAAIALGLSLLVQGGLRWPEVAAATLMIGAAVAAALRPGLTVPCACLILAAVAMNLFSLPLRWPGRLLWSSDALFTLSLIHI